MRDSQITHLRKLLHSPQGYRKGRHWRDRIRQDIRRLEDKERDKEEDKYEDEIDEAVGL